MRVMMGMREIRVGMTGIKVGMMEMRGIRKAMRVIRVWTMRMWGIRVGMMGMQWIRVGMPGIWVGIRVIRVKIFDTLVWETIKETNLNTDFCFHKYYFILKNWKYAQYNCVFCYSVNAQKQPSIGVLQKRCSAKAQQIYWRSSMQNWLLHKSAFLEMSTSLDDVKIKVITMVLISVMLVIIYCDWFCYY